MSFELKPPANVHDDLIERGEETYQRLVPILEPSHVGEFVALEPDSDRFFFGSTASAALIAARTAMPDKLFYLTRVGRETAHTVRSYVKNPGLIAHL